jgi:hypothetical protein
MAQTFENVRTTFLSPDEKSSDYVGTIVRRGREMVVDIPRQHTGGPYCFGDEPWSTSLLVSMTAAMPTR